MNKGKKDIITTRIISTSFTVLALAVFKPFGLDAWQWQAYVHLLVIWMIGVCICLLTDGILKYIVKMPQSTEHGVDYIIRRNLWFQLINTPLITLMVCLYRHFMLNDRVAGNQLSWSNYLETLAIIGFLSFAIGLYWRFKFRSKFLATELEETRLLNEQLQKLQREAAQRTQATEASTAHEPTEQAQPSEKVLEAPTSATITPPSSTIVLTGTTSETITLDVANLLYIEAVGNYVRVYQLQDGQVLTHMLRNTSKQIEDDLHAYPMIVRCHRAFLVNLQQVEQIVSKSGTVQLLIKHCHDHLPVSRSNMAQIKEALRVIA